MKLSAVIPVFNEEKNVAPLYDELKSALDVVGWPYEIIFVNDGSSDQTLHMLETISAKDNTVKVVNLQNNSGQSMATFKGFEAATGDYIVTLDGDRQNNPADIPAMVKMLSDEYPAVCGWRRNRKDKKIFVVSSKVANAIIRSLFGLTVHDSGCSLRVVKAGYLKQINYFKNFHRYIPIILCLKGVKMRELEVNHRWRSEGESKYSIFKSFRVLKELIYLRLFYKA